MPDLLRFQFAVGSELRFLSHLDLLRTFERALRRARIPVALTEGFHPKPRLSLAAPLPVGISSRAEFGDVFLRAPVAPAEFIARLNAVLPPGLTVLRAALTSERTAPVMAVVNAAEYRVQLEGNTITADNIQELLASEELFVLRSTKKGERTVDVRPLIFSIELRGGELVFRCALGPEGNLRPDELLGLLGLDIRDVLVERTGLFVRGDGAWCGPMDGIEGAHGN